MDSQMNSGELARYIGSTDSSSKPWLLAQLRLKKWQENQVHMSSADYVAALASMHQGLMNLGERWIGIEHEEFG
jgi:hypothetical protein